MRPFARRWLAAPFVAVIASLGLALGAGPAGATVSPTVFVDGIGTAGYEALVPSAVSVGGSIITNGPALNVGTLGAGGLGIQLCNPNDGFRVLLGEVSTGTGFNVDYASGIPAAGPIGKTCRTAGTFPASQAHELNSSNLDGLPVGDQVWLYMKHWDKTFCKPVPDADHDGDACVWTEVGRVWLQAFDANGLTLYDAIITIPADETFNAVGAGIQQNLTLVSACSPLDLLGGESTVDATPVNTGLGPVGEDGATDLGAEESGYLNPSGPAGSGACNEVAQFTGVSANPSSILTLGTPFAAFPAVQVASTAGAIRANPALAGPLYTLSGFDFEAFAGNPTGA